MQKIVFLFPGQGSQYVGMGKTLCDKFPIAKETFAEANKVLGYDLKKLCFNGPNEKLSDTIHTQPAILTASVAAFKVFRQETGIDPDIAVGHSFGTLSAMVCAGAFRFTDALKIARIKGKFSKENIAGKSSMMLAIENMNKTEIALICRKVSGSGGGAYIGIINSEKQIVISGDEPVVKKADKLFIERGARTERLFVSAPFHTPLLEKAAARTKKELSGYRFSRPKWPILSSITGKLHQDGSGIADDLYLDLIKPTDWLSAVKYLEKSKITRGIEIGPKAVLKKITEAATEKIKTYSFISPKDLEPLKEALKLDKKSKMEVLIAVLRIIVTTRNNNEDTEEFERGVSKPYREVKDLLLDLRKKDQEPTMEDIIDALKKLKLMMATKKLSKIEQRQRLRDEIFNDNETLLHIPEIRDIFKGIIRL